ncbi:uncharacterized protein LOC135084794 isoform X6 [Ostrinia nubilalis]|uniref:uncharacterized protein LOC135084794 isoform X6 n=1 Tax=Ostrinia nubilalis TaxID=29057 RepID=UPI0030824552
MHWIMEERRRCTTVRQLEVIIEFLEGNRDLALGRARSKEAREVAARLWQECAEVLNSLGPARTGKEWSRVWNDQTTKVRAKLFKINASQTATGEGPSSAPTLTPLEEKVANIIGRPLPKVAQNHSIDDDIIENEEVIEIEFGENESSPSSIDHSYYQDPLKEAPAADEDLSEYSPQEIPDSPVSDRAKTTRERRKAARSSIGPFLARASTSGQTPARVSTSRQTPARHSARNAPDESRLSVLKIEEMRAQAHLEMARGFSSIAESFKLIAESMARMSQQKKMSTAECRACLLQVQTGELHNLFHAWNSSWAGMKSTIAEDLSLLTEVQLTETDKHSKVICTSCCENLMKACKFKLLVQENDKMLRQRCPETENQSTDKVWPQPIQVDKSITGVYSEPLQVEIKQEVLTDDENMTNGDEGYSNVDCLDMIKIEPEEIAAPVTNAPSSFRVTDMNGQECLEEEMPHKKAVSKEEKRKRKKEAERLRRERIKADPEMYEAAKLKEKQRREKRKAENRIKTIHDLTPQQKRAQRKAWQECTRRHRMKKQLVNVNSDNTLPKKVESTRTDDKIGSKSKCITKDAR